MAAKPYLTSNDLIECVKRKISAPTYQNFLTDPEILKFLNEEMLISQVPAVLSYHEEYYTVSRKVPIKANVSRYSIPTRAIGMKLRDMMYLDTSQNISEMTRISPEDRAYFQRQLGSSADIYKFYVEGNDIVLSPGVTSQVGYLLMSYYIRPNQLVADERAAVMNGFSQTITINFGSLNDGDYVTINSQEIVAKTSPSASNEFAIGVDGITTASNMCTVINNLGLGYTATNNNTTNVATLTSSDIGLFILNIDSKDASNTISNISASSAGFNIPSTLICNFNNMPEHLAAGSVVDFLETNPGHRIKNTDVTVRAISGNQAIFNLTDIPYNLASNDYICLQYEAIIPYLPPDLHNGLAERAAARILAAIGDQQGLAMVNAKLAENKDREGTLLSDRVEGAPMKLFNKYSLLRMGKWGRSRRRY